MSDLIMPMPETESNHPSSGLLERCVQVFDGAFDAGFCRQMIHSYHQLARFHKANGKGVRAGHNHSGWTELDVTPLTDEGFRGLILQNMHQHLARYNQALAQPIDVPGTQKTSELVIKHYNRESHDSFQLHFDSLGAVANRYLVFLWYLNDVEEGGETHFPMLNLKVAARTGRLVIFPPYWMFQHEGRMPVSGDKYILSTYFLF